MNEQMNNSEEMVEISIKRLLDVVLQKTWSIALASVLGAVIVFVCTFLFVTPKYESSAMFYVNNNSISVGDVSLSSITSSDITASKNLVNSYIVILRTRESLNDVIDYAGVNRTYKEVREMISAVSVNDTEIFEVVVSSSDPEEAEKIASAIAYILPKRISSIIEGTSAKVVDSAVLPSKPSSPSYTMNTVLGFALGLILSVGIIVLQELFDVTIRTEEDIGHVSKHPILAVVPDMTAPSKGGYYGYGEKKKSSTKRTGAAGQSVLVGGEITFAASEAYKLLRTKIQYSFAGDKDCRVIGVSSALTGEGKSLTAVNLAHTLSQLDNKVLLIDCDMRRPSLPAKLPIQKKPGLSGFLAGQTQENTLFQYCGIPGDEKAFHVIASGQNPPNPVELLSSDRMTKMLKQLRGVYDYIILDLPPVGEVTDALAVAKETDGILIVVRQNYCNRIALSNVVRQFEFVGARILGITYNYATENTGAYGKKYYKKYYNSKANETGAQEQGRTRARSSNESSN